MIELFVFPFAERRRAAEVFASLQREPFGFLAESGDAVVIAKDELGVVRLTRTDVLDGEPGFPWRALVRGLLLEDDPALGLNPGFVSSIRALMPAGSSAIVVVRRQFVPDRAFAALSELGATPWRTLLPDEVVTALKNAPDL